MSPSYTERPGRRRGRPIRRAGCACGGRPAKALGFVRRLVGDALEHGAVQTQVIQLARAKRAQFVKRVAVDLPTRQRGAEVCDISRKLFRQALRCDRRDVALVCHVCLCLEYRLRFVEPKIGKCCNCTISICFNAAMQQLHRLNGGNFSNPSKRWVICGQAVAGPRVECHLQTTVKENAHACNS